MLLFPYRESFTVMEEVIAIGIRRFISRKLLGKALLFGVISEGEPGLLLDTDQGGNPAARGWFILYYFRLLVFLLP